MTIRIAGGLMGQDIHKARRVWREMMGEAGYSETDGKQDWLGQLVSWRDASESVLYVFGKGQSELEM